MKQPLMVQTEGKAPSHGQMFADFMPKCANCGAAHPKALLDVGNPQRMRELLSDGGLRQRLVAARDAGICHVCAHPSGLGFRRVVNLRLPGMLGWAVDQCNALAQFLRKAAERLREDPR